MALEETTVTLYAANGTAINILGAIHLDFVIDGLPVSASLMVSDEIEELILGIDWLIEHGCQWNFMTATISIHDRDVKLYRRPSKPCVRRVYAAEEYVVPPKHQASVPIRCTWSNLHAPGSDWMIETKAIERGVVAARTLLSRESDVAAIRVLNYSDKPYVVRANRFLGTAQPVKCLKSDVTVGIASETSGTRHMPVGVRSDMPVGTTDETIGVRHMPVGTNNAASAADVSHIKCV